MARKSKIIVTLTIKSPPKTAMGHQPHITGSGVHRSVRQDKKIRRRMDRQLTAN